MAQHTISSQELSQFRGYVETLEELLSGSSFDWKPAVKVATTADITLSGEQTVDGVALVEGDRILVKDQSTGAENGIYVVDEAAWPRADDANGANVTPSMAVFVQEGTVGADAMFVLTNNAPIVVDTTALTFARFGEVPNPFTPGGGIFSIIGEISARASGGAVNSEQFGEGADASGASSTAVGDSSTASGIRATAIGQGAVVTVPNATAIGQTSSCDTGGDGGVAAGYQSFVNGLNGIAIGQASLVSGDNCILIKPLATSRTLSGDRNISIGDPGGNITGDDNTSLGNLITMVVGASNQVAIGSSADTTSGDATAVGAQSSAGDRATAVGFGADATGSVSTAIGENSTASGTNAVAVGRSSSAGADGTAIGTSCGATGARSVAVGTNASANVLEATALGYNADVAATGGIAIGESSDVVATHTDAVAIGREAQTTAANRCTIGTIGGAVDIELQVGLGLAVWGATPPGSQPAKIVDPTDLAESITAIEAIIDVLEGAGLSAAV